MLSERDRQEPSIASLAALVACLLAGVACAALAMPAIFRMIPSDLTRYELVLQTISGDRGAPQTLVFGSSIAMNGIDTRLLTDEAPWAGLAYNLSTTGQSLVESILLQQDMTDDVRTVVQIVSGLNLASDRPVEPNKYNALYMYGFRPSTDTRDFLTVAFPGELDDSVDASDLAQRFRARWALRQFVDTSARKLLRPDLSLDRARTDLFYPSPYNDRVLGEQLDRLIEAETARWPAPDFEIVAAKQRVLEELARRAEAAGRHLVLVMPPIHPRVRAALGPGYFDGLRALLAATAAAVEGTFVDASELLGEEQFIDHVHPTDEGARRLTLRIAEAR